MKTEQQASNSRDNTDDKLMAVLVYFLSLHDADEISNMINDPQFEVADVIERLDLITITLNEL